MSSQAEVMKQNHHKETERQTTNWGNICNKWHTVLSSNNSIVINKKLFPITKEKINTTVENWAKYLKGILQKMTTSLPPGPLMCQCAKHYNFIKSPQQTSKEGPIKYVYFQKKNWDSQRFNSLPSSESKLYVKLLYCPYLSSKKLK